MATRTIRGVTLPPGDVVPALGQGTWHIADDPSRRVSAISALRTGIELRMSLIDTAEVYGNGNAERLVGEAIRGQPRSDLFLVSKVWPTHASDSGAIAACRASLGRLDTDYLDLYLLHWRGSFPLEETIAGFEWLMHAGDIRMWGVSNFGVADMEELLATRGGAAVMTDQVPYNLARRRIELDLMPWCGAHGIPLMAYSPIEQGRILGHPIIHEVATRHGATPAHVALAWVLRHDNVIAIPEAGNPEHVRENRAALDLHLTGADLADLDRAFPPPPSSAQARTTGRARLT
jgi:diketogulonate reductase-like aldo/keto reductase